MLKKRKMPLLGHEVYSSRPVGYDKNGKEINKPVYKPSKKWPGHFVDMNHMTQYHDENAEGTMFHKIGKDGKMVQAGFLNMKNK